MVVLNGMTAAEIIRNKYSLTCSIFGTFVRACSALYFEVAVPMDANNKEFV